VYRVLLPLGISLLLLFVGFDLYRNQQLERAFRERDTQAVLQMLRWGANPRGIVCSKRKPSVFFDGCAEGKPFLHEALLFPPPDRLTIVKALLQKGVKVTERTLQSGSRGYTLLAPAVYENDVELVKLLLKNGADPRSDWIDIGGYLLERDSKILLAFLDAGMPPDNFLFRDSAPLISEACRINNIEALRLLLDRGANPDARRPSYQETNALMQAAESANPKAVEVLLYYRAKVNETDRHQQTALHYALKSLRRLASEENLRQNPDRLQQFSAHFAIAEMLIREKADLDRRDAENSGRRADGTSPTTGETPREILQEIRGILATYPPTDTLQTFRRLCDQWVQLPRQTVASTTSAVR